MKPAPFTLHSPESLPEALDLLANVPNARVIAGGQSLMPMLNMRLAQIDHLIDINGIFSLAGIREEGDDIVIGAMTRQRDVEFSALVRSKLPLLADAILETGHRQTRNRGTIGGSLCNLDPSAEQVTVAVAFEARLRVEKKGVSRIVPIADFVRDTMTTCLEPDEMLTEIRLRAWPDGHGHAFLEYGRRHGDYAIAAAAVLLERGAAGSVTRASVTLGGVGAVPFRLPAAEAILTGAAPDAQTIGAAAAEAETVEALSDAAYPAWYRRRLARTLLARAIAKAAERAERKAIAR